MSQPPSASDLPPPGWYDDPHGAPELRYWNGFAWTDEVAADQGRMRPFSDWLSRTFELMTGRAGPLFTIAVLSLPTAILSTLAFWRGIRDATIDFEVLVDEVEPGEWDQVFQGFDLNSLALAGVAFLVGTLFGAVLNVAFVRQLHVASQGIDRRQGIDESWLASVGAGFKRFFRFVGVLIGYQLVVWGVLIVSMVIFWVGIAVEQQAVVALALLAMLAAFGVALWLGVRLWMCYIPASVAPRGTSSFRTAWNMSRERFFPFLGRGAMLIVLWFGFSTVASTIAQLPLGSPGPDPGDGVFPVRLAFGGSLIGFLLTTIVSTLANQVGRILQHAGSVVVYDDLGGPSELATEPISEVSAS